MRSLESVKDRRPGGWVRGRGAWSCKWADRDGGAPQEGVLASEAREAGPQDFSLKIHFFSDWTFSCRKEWDWGEEANGERTTRMATTERMRARRNSCRLGVRVDEEEHCIHSIITVVNWQKQLLGKGSWEWINAKVILMMHLYRLYFWLPDDFAVLSSSWESATRRIFKRSDLKHARVFVCTGTVHSHVSTAFRGSQNLVPSPWSFIYHWMGLLYMLLVITWVFRYLVGNDIKHSWPEIEISQIYVVILVVPVTSVRTFCHSRQH